MLSHRREGPLGLLYGTSKPTIQWNRLLPKNRVRRREAWKKWVMYMSGFIWEKMVLSDTWLMPNCWGKSSSRSCWCVRVGLRYTKALPQCHICSSAVSVGILWAAVFPCSTWDLRKVWRVGRKTFGVQDNRSRELRRIWIACPFHKHLMWRLLDLKKQVNPEHPPSLEEWSLSLIIYC